MKWTICFADREYARQLGDPDLGEVEADSQEQAVEKAYADRAIARRTFGHCATLWAYPSRQRDDERGR